MSFRNFLQAAVLTAASFGMVTFASAEKPNIVLYLSDDLGYADISVMGHPYAKTPNLDRLAKEGTVFMQHYAAGVTCAPSRAGLMTGVHPTRFPYYPGSYGTGNRLTITDLLHENGYATGHFGKWHMGPDESVGTYGYDVLFTVNNNGNVLKTASRDEPATDHAIEFIEQMAKEEKPFYVNLWGHSSHYPIKNNDELIEEMGEIPFNRDDFADYMQERFDRSVACKPDLKDSMTQYVADVYGIDKNVGRIMDTLERLGIADNTILVFSSDNGPQNENTQRPYAEHMLGYPGELRGHKGVQYEGGMSVPFIIRWPGRVEAGRVDKVSVTSFLDWLPTLANIAGATPIPEQLDGEDVSDIWLNGPRPRETYLFWAKATPPDEPFTIRDGRWKLHVAETGLELYDMLTDRSEKHDIVGKYPEIADRLLAKVRSIEATLPQEYIANNNLSKEEFDALDIPPPQF